LSGGQARRIALARAFLKDSPLVVTDEPTTGLDAHSEALLAEALAELSRGRAMLTICHRLALLAENDRIAVIERGRVVEQGGYKELAAAGGAFARMLAAGEGA
ncbi:MAG TPA: ATP-binding cassette domain-containing protein, partial [Desulfuromonadaceae bacterium]